MNIYYMYEHCALLGTVLKHMIMYEHCTWQVSYDVFYVLACIICIDMYYMFWHVLYVSTLYMTSVIWCILCMNMYYMYQHCTWQVSYDVFYVWTCIICIDTVPDKCMNIHNRERDLYGVAVAVHVHGIITRTCRHLSGTVFIHIIMYCINTVPDKCHMNICICMNIHDRERDLYEHTW